MTTQTANSTPEMSTSEDPLVGLSPQMLACLLMGTILFGVVVSGAYIVTRRAVEPAAAAAAAAAPVAPAAPIQPASALAAAPSVAAVPVQAVAPAPAVIQPPQPQPQAQSLTITAAEASGKTFLQVGAIERAAIPGFVQELAAKGFSPRVAEGPTADSVRILIGPLSGTALPETAARLAAAGVVSFPKTY
ncbi:MAG: hypothetical protein IPP47_23940 [Bryobacterales bacterium]|nr:hypothetical protein [Bryobacterales bacterium]